MNRIILQNGFLIDCTGKEPKENVSIAIEDNKIVELREGKISTADSVIDLDGKTILPGLIDAHIHACSIDLHESEQLNKYPAAQLVCMSALNLEQTLMQGFTTVRDAGGADWGFRVCVEKGYIKGPRLLVSGDPLTQTGGGADRRKPTETQMPESGCVGFPTSIVCDGVDAVRRAAREQLRKGVDQLKVFASGASTAGGGGLTTTEFTVDELSVIVSEAGARGKYVMAHALPPQSIKNCVMAGVKSIEHGNLLDEESAKMMKEHGTYLVPTLVTYDELSLIAEKSGFPNETIRRLKMGAENSLRALRIANEFGIKIASGSDLIGPLQDRRAREIELKANVMTKMEALISATKTNSELFGMQDIIGTIEVGKLADIIVVNGNPLKDIRLIQDRNNIQLIMKNGVVYKNDLASNQNP